MDVLIVGNAFDLGSRAEVDFARLQCRRSGRSEAKCCRSSPPAADTVGAPSEMAVRWLKARESRGCCCAGGGLQRRNQRCNHPVPFLTLECMAGSKGAHAAAYPCIRWMLHRRCHCLHEIHFSTSIHTHHVSLPPPPDYDQPGNVKPTCKGRFWCRREVAVLPQLS